MGPGVGEAAGVHGQLTQGSTHAPFCLQVVWEMLTGTKPWHQAPTHLAIILAVNQLGKRLPIPGPPRCPPALAALISACWAQDAQDRPSAADALQQLRGMLQDAWTTEGEGESA